MRRVNDYRLPRHTFCVLMLALMGVMAGVCTVNAGEKPAQHDIAYGVDKEQTLDIYMPAQPQAAPIIFMVHGGGWRHGDKDNSRVVDNKVKRWVARGFIFISVNYRMLPARDALQQRDDIIAALVFAQRHAADWGGDPAQIILMGHSAGAHLVALIDADPAPALAAGAQRWLGTVALDSAALDVVQIMQRRHIRLYDPAFGTDPARWQLASPLHQLHPSAPPLLAVCSTQRRDQPCAQAQAFRERAKKLGVTVDMLPQDLSHGQINAKLGEPGAYTDAVERFMRALSPVLATKLAP
jgi:acetyl esterase/lipase